MHEHEESKAEKKTPNNGVGFRAGTEFFFRQSLSYPLICKTNACHPDIIKVQPPVNSIGLGS
jgi:hypothetical protein